MRKLLLSLFFVPFFLISTAQETSVNGTITDTLSKINLKNAVVTLLQKKDSTLYKFSRTTSNGKFVINDVHPGNYILLITFPKFADFADVVELKEGSNDLNSIPLTLKAKLLDAIIIRSAAAIRIKGDTTEFAADSFKVREGATVEELLRKLPGFQVNSKGEITAQGQRVQKVLVDGEEFFGDDPTMATQNISAKAVDKVQIYDTKTDRQQLTGIASGNEGKTVNIKLKEEAKKGAFGKGHIASNFKDLVDAKALYNKFKGTKKISFYGTKSDISTGSLNWEDREKLGIEDDFQYDEVSGYYISFGSSDEFNDWSLRGLPNSYTAGGLYSNKWRDGKNNINGSYRFNRLATENDASTLTQNILSNSITYRNRFQKTNGLNQQHNFTGKYEWKIDSLASLKFTTLGLRKTSELFSNGNNEFLNESREYINRSHQVVDNSSTRLQNDNQLTYRQAFMKKNRLLIATFRLGIIEDEQDGTIKTNSEFYRNNVIDSVDYADQFKLFNGSSRTLGTKITFNEPLGIKWNLILDYAYNQNNSYSHRNTFNKDFTGKYAEPDLEFSNNFEVDAASHTGSSMMRFIDKKLRFTFGSGISTVKLNLQNLDNNQKNVYNFLNLTPQTNLTYTFKPQTFLSFNYSGTTRQPTIAQLQPIRENTDRLNIFIGNPDLKVGFNHNIRVSYNSFKTLSQQYFSTSFNYNIPVNAIAFFNTVDVTRGLQTYMPVNVNGNRSWNLYGNFHKRGGEKKLNFGSNFYINGGRNINFVNGARNTTNYTNSNLNINFSYDKDDENTFSFGPQAGYNISNSSLFKTFNSNFWTYGGRFNVNWMLPGKINFSTDGNLNFRQQLSGFNTNLNQTIWNASISKKVLKDKSGKIYFLVNDILNQNIGFNRNITSNFISEDRFLRISRYFLLKFEWTFSAMPFLK